MNLEKILERIDAKDIERKATLATLNKLCMKFVSNIPFETLDKFGGEKRVWDIEKIYEKVIIENRGGLCYDLSGLFQWVLKLIGFKVDLLKGYLYQKKEFYKISDHLTLMVTLENGDKYLTDVGWGGSCFALPLKMVIGVEQSQPNGVYRLGGKEGKITVEKKKQTYLKHQEDIIRFETETERSMVCGKDGGYDEWNIQFGFTEQPYELEDFEWGYNYAQFEEKLLLYDVFVTLQNEKGRKFFYNNLFYEKEYVNPEVIKLVRFKKCTLDEMYRILENEFGLKIDFPLKLKNYVA